MKQFNLDEYLANPSKKVVTRRGLNARIICTDRKDLIYPIIVLIETKSGGEYFQYSTKDGKYYVDDLYEDDLFFAPEKHEVWINLYKWDNSVGCYVSNPFSSEEKAIEAGKKSNSYLKTVKIEWEE